MSKVLCRCGLLVLTTLASASPALSMTYQITRAISVGGYNSSGQYTYLTLPSATVPGGWGVGLSDIRELTNSRAEFSTSTSIEADHYLFELAAKGWGMGLNGYSAGAQSSVTQRVTGQLRPSSRNTPPNHVVRMTFGVEIAGTSAASDYEPFGPPDGPGMGATQNSLFVKINGQFVAYEWDRVDNGGRFNSFPPNAWGNLQGVNSGSPVSFELEVNASGSLGTSSRPGSTHWFESPDHNIGDAFEFRWVGVVGALDMTTGQPIPLNDVELMDDEGRDWAHPGVVVGVGDIPAVAQAISFLGAQPNPVRPGTLLRFRTAADASVRMDIFDVAGRWIASPVDGRFLTRGEHHIPWDGRDRTGARVSAGIYQVRVTADGKTATGRIIAAD